MGLDTRADALLVGCLLGLIVAWGLLPTSKPFVARIKTAAGCSALVIVWLAFFRDLGSSQYYHGLFTALAVMVAVIIARMLSAPPGPVSRLLESKALTAIGRVSYGLYLYHSPIYSYLDAHGTVRQRPGAAVLAVAATVAATLVSYMLIERPCLRLKDRLRERRSATPNVADVAVVHSPASTRPASRAA
jgi:peptidoglycan/LPS O-acetylase OafA/YrhL